MDLQGPSVRTDILKSLRSQNCKSVKAFLGKMRKYRQTLETLRLTARPVQYSEYLNKAN